MFKHRLTYCCYKFWIKSIICELKSRLKEMSRRQISNFDTNPTCQPPICPQRLSPTRRLPGPCPVLPCPASASTQASPAVWLSQSLLVSSQPLWNVWGG